MTFQFIEVPAGTRFGRLTVVEDRRRGKETVLCRCDCGTFTRPMVRMLRTGNTKSCGCLLRERSASRAAAWTPHETGEL